MAGIFPYSQDGGLSPNPMQPNNPAQAFDPLIPPQDTSALYYGNGCDVRLRPHVVNSLISEIAATAGRAGLPYRAASLQNLEFAVRYLIQRGLPRGALLVEVNPFNFTVTLDPPPKTYTDFMTLTLVPQMLGAETQNQGYVRINVNGLGFVPLYRNDGQELRAADLRPGKPFIVAYYQGAFYVVGLSNSQVPLVLVGSVDFWIRPDGHDDTGDGTANTPDKAFRTIDGCWAAVGSRYAGSPTATIVLHLGIPGDYEGGHIGPYGGNLVLFGDHDNAAGYRILSKITTDGTPAMYSLYSEGVTNLQVIGVNLVLNSTYQAPAGVMVLVVHGGAILLDSMRFTLEVDNPVAIMAGFEVGSSAFSLEHVYVIGNGHTVSDGIHVGQASQVLGAANPTLATWHWNDIHFAFAGYAVGDRSGIAHAGVTNILSNTTGMRYAVSGSSNLFLNGQQAPGDTAGVYSTQGQVIP